MKMLMRGSIMVPVLLILAACASTGSQDGVRRDSRYISQEEIAATTSASTLYDVVYQLRPRWLTVRASRSLTGLQPAIVVYQGNSLLGGPDILRQFDPSAVYALRYLDGSTASASLPGLGSRHVEGAIILITGPEG